MNFENIMEENCRIFHLVYIFMKYSYVSRCTYFIQLIILNWINMFVASFIKKWQWVLKDINSKNFIFLYTILKQLHNPYSMSISYTDRSIHQNSAIFKTKRSLTWISLQSSVSGIYRPVTEMKEEFLLLSFKYQYV